MHYTKNIRINLSLAQTWRSCLRRAPLGKADWPKWGSLLKSPVWTDPAFAALRQHSFNPSCKAVVPSATPIAMKDVVGFQAEFGDYKKVVLASSNLMTVVNARSTHRILVECSDGDVPYSEGLMRVANWGTRVIMFGKATVIQDELDQNIGDGASHVCNFSATSTLYLGSPEERQLYLPNPRLTGLGGMLPVVLLSPEAASLPSCMASKLGLQPSIIAMLMLRAGLGERRPRGARSAPRGARAVRVYSTCTDNFFFPLLLHSAPHHY